MTIATTKKNNRSENTASALGAASAPAKAAAGPARGGLRRTPTQEEIATRAYELYVQRGCADGHAEEDWAQAQRELTGGKN